MKRLEQHTVQAFLLLLNLFCHVQRMREIEVVKALRMIKKQIGDTKLVVIKLLMEDRK
ncbi:MAG: hypothetical protein N2484_12750 [Clostridia bacterium]|nr:hypothetical protein [Clostridia bacterium]